MGRIQNTTGHYGKSSAPFGNYWRPKTSVVDIPDDFLNSESICLIDKVKDIGSSLLGFLLFMKKKCVRQVDYGWEIQYEETNDTLKVGILVSLGFRVLFNLFKIFGIQWYIGAMPLRDWVLSHFPPKWLPSRM